MQNFKRIIYLLLNTSLYEFVYIAYHYFFKQDLHLVHPMFHSMLVVFIHQHDEGNHTAKNSQRNITSLQVNNKAMSILLRRNTSDFLIFNQIFIRQDYALLLREVDLYLSQAGVSFIIDAGANIGCATLLFKAHFPDAHLVAIEPEESNFKSLQANVARNGLKKVDCLRGALWNEVEELELKSDFRDGSNSAFRVATHKEDSLYKVDGYNFKYLLNKYAAFPIIDILKMDIEGAEKFIFEDANCVQSFLPKTKFIAIEVHPEVISEVEIKRILSEYRFELKHFGEYLIGINLDLL